MFFKGEDDPRTRGTGHFVYVLDSAPDWERFVRVWDRASRILPPLYKRVVSPPFPVACPLWQDDPDFDLRFHLRRLSVPAPGTLREVLDYAEVDGMTPHDPGRPLWQVTLMEGLDDGRRGGTAPEVPPLVDGRQRHRSSWRSWSTTPTETPTSPRPMPERPAVRRPSGTRRSSAVTRARCRPRAAWTAALVGDAGRLSLAVVTDPLEHPRPRPPSWWRRPAGWSRRSPRRRHRCCGAGAPDHASRSSTSRSRTCASRGKAIDCTVNDAYLAGVAGGLRRYHEHFGAARSTTMPDRDADQHALRRRPSPSGTRSAATMIAAPIGVDDPVERMQRFHEIVLGARYEPAMEVLSGAAPTSWCTCPTG